VLVSAVLAKAVVAYAAVAGTMAPAVHVFNGLRMLTSAVRPCSCNCCAGPSSVSLCGSGWCSGSLCSGSWYDGSRSECIPTACYLEGACCASGCMLAWWLHAVPVGCTLAWWRHAVPKTVCLPGGCMLGLVAACWPGGCMLCLLMHVGLVAACCARWPQACLVPACWAC
jgi:hypothetical protein